MKGIRLTLMRGDSQKRNRCSVCKTIHLGTCTDFFPRRSVSRDSSNLVVSLDRRPAASPAWDVNVCQADTQRDFAEEYQTDFVTERPLSDSTLILLIGSLGSGKESQVLNNAPAPVSLSRLRRRLLQFKCSQRDRRALLENRFDHIRFCASAKDRHL